MITFTLFFACAQIAPFESPARGLEFFGKINADWAVIDADSGLEAATGDYGNGAVLRRARLGLMGPVHEGVDLKMTADLAAAEIRDAFFDVHGIVDQGFFRLGHFREPMGLVNQTPSHFLTFMERPMSSSLFPSRNLGIAWRREWKQELATFTIGIFRESNDAGESIDDGSGNEMALTGRWSWAPYHVGEGDQMVHIGSSFSWRNPDAGMVQFDGDLGTTIGPSLVDTGALTAEQVLLLGADVAWQSGANVLAAELEYASFDQKSGDRPTMIGWYLEASHFLTGEARTYKLSRPAFAPPDPAQNWNQADGIGAWELGLRISQLDLDDQSVAGGTGRNLGVALNWYLTSNLRLQTNVFRVTRDGEGDANVFAMRFHLDF